MVDTINFLMNRPEWKDTAVIINYDDSDGWYDHQMGPIVNQSQTAADMLNGAGFCGMSVPVLSGITAPNAQGRCGYGPRLPLMVISPWTRPNVVDHTLTDQSSILRFIEDNWLWNQRIGQGSYDQAAGSIESMFLWTLHSPCYRTLILSDETGELVTKGCSQ